MAVLAAAAVLGVGLALLVYWILGTSPGPLGPLAGVWDVATIGLPMVAAVALIVGITRVIMPCGLPVLLGTAEVLKGGRSLPPFLLRSLTFTLGASLALGVAGAVLGGLGGALLGFAGSEMQRMMLARWLYTGVAVVALLFGLSELGLVRLGGVMGSPFRSRGPIATARRLPVGDYLQCAGIGVLIGGGFGIACPLPTTTILMVWVASAGSVGAGLLVGVLFGIGISLPVVGVASLLRRGAELPAIGSAVWARGAWVRSVSGGSIIMFAVFTLVFWTVLLGI